MGKILRNLLNLRMMTLILIIEINCRPLSNISKETFCVAFYIFSFIFHNISLNKTLDRAIKSEILICKMHKECFVHYENFILVYKFLRNEFVCGCSCIKRMNPNTTHFYILRSIAHDFLSL